MPITESQLSTWSNQGSIIMSSQTYDSIKNCISKISWRNDVSYDIFLQGSYKNSTNIYGESDVDIVIEFTSIFSSDTSNLDSVGLAEHNALSPAEYNLESFKAVIVKKLIENYGEANIQVGPKAIKIEQNGSRLKADVLVCNSFKKYLKNNMTALLPSIDGIIFSNADTGDKIINYPKIHYQNGVAKNSQLNTNSNYKSTVRIFRNIKAFLVNSRKISSQEAPSYFVECLLYNGQNIYFTHATYQQRVQSLLIQFYNDLNNNNFENYICQNEQIKLFGVKNQQWDINNAKKFIVEIIKLWN